jgi:hypothetical protein
MGYQMSYIMIQIKHSIQCNQGLEATCIYDEDGMKLFCKDAAETLEQKGAGSLRIICSEVFHVAKLEPLLEFAHYIISYGIRVILEVPPKFIVPELPGVWSPLARKMLTLAFGQQKKHG